MILPHKEQFCNASIEEGRQDNSADRVIRENFAREVKLDLSTSEKEFENLHIPLNDVDILVAITLKKQDAEASAWLPPRN